MNIPTIKKINGHKQLLVKGSPFVMLAGEVHNSSSSSLQYMEEVWEKAEELGMNSLLVPITWELLEPQESVFSFDLVDGLIHQARTRGKKLGLLWFGTWKNAQSTYAPEWIKTDLQRFRRAEVVKGCNRATLKDFHGMSYTSLSYLCKETQQADTKAFRALMRHLKEIDGDENTVITVQVENETGLQGAAREHSDEADALFAAAVPQDFVDFMKENTQTMSADVRKAVQAGTAAGSWAEVFGEVAEEVFSAYHIARYVNCVAEAGKQEYPLPLTANCWLDKGEAPGIYPAGGPVARMMEVWKYCAPAIDVIAPDIYVPNFCEICEEYTKLDNPLFIPEASTHCYAGSRLVYTVGHHHTMCYAPFGFEDMGKPFDSPFAALFGADTSDPALTTPQNVEEYGWYARTLQSMLPLLIAKYGTPDLQAVIGEQAEEPVMRFGNLGFVALNNGPIAFRKDGVCLVLKQSKNEFYVIANGCMLAPFSADPENPHVDILLMEEGRFENGNWKADRRLNGDELHTLIETPVLLRIKLFAYC